MWATNIRFLSETISPQDSGAFLFTSRSETLYNALEMASKDSISLDIDRYSSPGQYRDAAKERGIGVTTTFCHSVTQTIEKYTLTFPQACRLLESKGYLIWAGFLPIIDLSGSDFWESAQHEQDMPEQVEAESTQEEANQTSTYNPASEIRCVFFTLAIRNEALETKYSGGLEEFVRRYCSEYNDDITTIVAMSFEELNEASNDLEKNGFIYKEDCLLFDASAGYYPVNGTNVNLGISWLKARYSSKSGMVVSFNPA